MSKQKKDPHEKLRAAAAEIIRASDGPHTPQQRANLARHEIDLALFEAERDADAAAEAAGGELVELVCPKCGSGESLGTNETIPGTARATFSRTAAGRVDVEHHGETDVCWDASESAGYFCGECCSEGDESELVTPRELAERESVEKIGRAVLAAIDATSSEPIEPDELLSIAGEIADAPIATWHAIAHSSAVACGIDATETGAR